MNKSAWTYGCEHEFGDWDTGEGWLENKGFGRDPEPNIVNSNGIAADPRLISYKFGGEITTPPTATCQGQGELLKMFLKKHPDAVANYRTGLHVHIRVPGLKHKLSTLKKVQQFIHDNRDVYMLIDPIELPTHEEFPEQEAYKAARKRAHWMRMSHHTSVQTDRVVKQMNAKTTREFFEAEVPRSANGAVLWHAQPRSAVSLRQLLQTNTIEFRHFVASTVIDEVVTAVTWCRDFLVLAFTGGSARKLFFNEYAHQKFPLLAEYPFDLITENRWKATSISKNKRPTIEKNIQQILEADKQDKK